MHEYSFIPVTKKKIPNARLLKQATGNTGWKVFQDRKPTIEEQKIFKQSSHLANVTGEISGITVIDLDGTAEQDLLNAGYVLPNTPTVTTQNGGKHLYFKYTDKIKTDVKINEHKNIDIRNNFAYVVASGEGYEWIKSPADTELQDVPAFFINMYKDKDSKPVKSVTGVNVSESLQDASARARGVNMVTFLRSKGYDVQEKHAFSCIFHEHEDNNPSSTIFTNDKGEQRYYCFSHEGGKLNLSLIDLWAGLNKLSFHKAIEEVLAFIGVEYEESEFIKEQRYKYHFNTVRVGDLKYIEENFKNLFKYLNRYELELRALMDFAEQKLHSTNYSYEGQAIFYISTRYAGEKFRRMKYTSTVNNDRAKVFFNILCTLGILERVPTDKVSEYAKEKTSRFTQEGNAINFYLFNQMTDYVLSIADSRAKQMQDSNFKVTTMTKDILIAIFNQDIADKVFPDKRKQSKVYKEFLRAYSIIILDHIENNGYTTKQEVVNDIDIPFSQRKKEYHFDKVIHEICTMYQLEFNMQSKELRQLFNISGRGRKRLLYKA